MTTDNEVLTYDPVYYGDASPVFDFKRKVFRPWSVSAFRHGYDASVSLPLGPKNRRWMELSVCWAVIAPHIS